MNNDHSTKVQCPHCNQWVSGKHDCMSNGREGLAYKIVGALMGAEGLNMPIIERVCIVLDILAKNRLYHEDDVVEGREIRDVLDECPDISECRKGNVFRCPAGWASSACRMYRTRPATIKDIIGGK